MYFLVRAYSPFFEKYKKKRSSVYVSVNLALADIILTFVGFYIIALSGL